MPAWKFYLCYLEYTYHVPAWRRASNFMIDYYNENLHWTTWQKAVQKWPAWAWDALARASIDDEPCEIAAIDGTTLSRTNASQHYLQRIDRKEVIARPVQEVVMVDIQRKKFLIMAFPFKTTRRKMRCTISHPEKSYNS